MTFPRFKTLYLFINPGLADGSHEIGFIGDTKYKIDNKIINIGNIIDVNLKIELNTLIVKLYFIFIILTRGELTINLNNLCDLYIFLDEDNKLYILYVGGVEKAIGNRINSGSKK